MSPRANRTSPRRIRTGAGAARAVAAAAVVGALAAACTDPGGGSIPTAPEPTLTAVARAPEAVPVLLAGDRAADLAVAAGRALFTSAPIVVLAPEDPAALARAAGIAVVLGVPLLVAGETATEGEAETGGSATPTAQDGPAAESALAAELDRLGTTHVVTTGAALPPEGTDLETIPAPVDGAALGAWLGVELVASEPVPPEGLTAAVAGLEPGEPVALEMAGDPAASDPTSPTATPSAGRATSTPEEEVPDLPERAPTEPVDGVVVLSDGDAAQVAAVATARAAGAEVRLVPSGDIRGDRPVLDLLAGGGRAVVALGDRFGPQEVLAARVAAAETGVLLGTGTQLVFVDDAGREVMYVALYGTPGTGALGVLGEQGVPETVARAREHATAFELHTDRRVIPSAEIIATVASKAAGDDGDYSAERPIEDLRPLVDAAGAAGMQVVLDLQPGRTDFLTQAKRYEELLRLPHVGLALDPEWRLKPDQIHLRQIGSVGIDEVNSVVNWLADLVRDNRLPQKPMILHQFRLSMIADRDRLDTSRPELALMIHVDGQGTQPAKNDTWRVLRAGAPEVSWGWKNFYDEDLPMLTPEQTMRVDPAPRLVSYQ